MSEMFAPYDRRPSEWHRQTEAENQRLRSMFTAEDVAYLRAKADREDEMAAIMGSKRPSPLHGIADRIESMLPPREVKG